MATEAEIESLAIDIWVATGHRASDWVYMAPELTRKRRYMAYASNLLKVQRSSRVLETVFNEDGTVSLVEKPDPNQGELFRRVGGEWVMYEGK